jgi:DNA-binding CsgD family transcriptional regulator
MASAKRQRRHRQENRSGGDGGYTPTAQPDNREMERLREALDSARRGGTAASVRREISESWERSLHSGLRPDRFEVPYEPVVESSRLSPFAHPILQSLAGDLEGSKVSVLLADADGHVLERHVSDRALNDRLDRISLAPGFTYAEDAIGTNAIGTAVAQKDPSVVLGVEHFADALTGMACAASPVTDETTGRLIGIVDLTSFAEDANELMLPLAKQAARAIEERLESDSPVAKHEMLKHFLRLRRRIKGPFVVVSGATTLANAAASYLLSSTDEALLREYGSEVLARRRPTGLSEIVLDDGQRMWVDTVRLDDRSHPPAVMLRIMPPPTGENNGESQDGTDTRGWASLTATEKSVAKLVASGLTNRESAAKLLVSPYTVDFHLRSIFRKLAVRSRVELARLVASDPDCDV